MELRAIACVVALALVPLHAATAKDDPVCGSWRAFVESVKPDETRSLAFRTSWGSQFKDDKDPSNQFVLSAKRCEHNDYAPAEAVCASLMEHGAIEFSDWNLKDAVRCLSRKTRLAPELSFESATISLTYGTENRGANVDLVYAEDPIIGGMVLKVTANGY